MSESESNESKGWKVFGHQPIVTPWGKTANIVFQMDNRQVSIATQTPVMHEGLDIDTVLLSRADLRCYEATHAPRQCHAGPEGGNPAEIPNTDAFFSQWDRDVTHRVFGISIGAIVRADAQIMKRAMGWLYGDVKVDTSDILDAPTMAQTGGE